MATRDLDSLLSNWRNYFEDSSADTSAFGNAALPRSLPHQVVDFQLRASRIRLRIHEPELVDEVLPRLESLRSSNHGDPDSVFDLWQNEGTTCLARGRQIIASEENPNAIRSILLQEMVRCTEKTRKWNAILHAGACGIGDSCVLIAGQSHSGKTTLSAALMASGLKFYCDDSAALSEEDGRISPMPFRMMVREGSWKVLHTKYPEVLSSPVFRRWGQNVRFVDPLASQLAASPGLATALVFVSYSPEHELSLNPISPFEALLKLQESGFWVEHEKQSISRFLAWLQKIPAFTLAYSDLDAAISAVRKLADS